MKKEKLEPKVGDYVVVKPNIDKYKDTLVVGTIHEFFDVFYYVKYLLPDNNTFTSAYFREDILYHSTDIEEIKKFIDDNKI